MPSEDIGKIFQFPLIFDLRFVHLQTLAVKKRRECSRPLERSLSWAKCSRIPHESCDPITEMAPISLANVYAMIFLGAVNFCTGKIPIKIPLFGLLRTPSLSLIYFSRGRVTRFER
jgi:hypothetical protein